jgi:hypothetical protein
LGLEIVAQGVRSWGAHWRYYLLDISLLMFGLVGLAVALLRLPRFIKSSAV